MKTCERTVEYNCWTAMRARCKSHPEYAGRGITVCERWNSFECFLEDMGERPGPEYSIDRIDNNGNYEPSNCRWTTRNVQLSNRRPYRHNYTDPMRNISTMGKRWRVQMMLLTTRVNEYFDNLTDAINFRDTLEYERIFHKIHGLYD